MDPSAAPAFSTADILETVRAIQDIAGSVRERQWKARRDFGGFAERFPQLFDKACEPDFDFERLRHFLALRDQVEAGVVTKDKADVQIGQEMFDKYAARQVKRK